MRASHPTSLATKLLAGDGNGRSDVFVKDFLTGNIIRVNVCAADQQGTGGDGQQIGFVCARLDISGRPRFSCNL